MLEFPNSTDRAHVTWNEEGKSLPQFAYVMLGLDDDSLNVLLSDWNLQEKLKNGPILNPGWVGQLGEGGKSWNNSPSSKTTHPRKNTLRDLQPGSTSQQRYYFKIEK